MGLRRNLGPVETVSMSVAVIGPTMAMSFNVSLAAQAAGRAAPLTFLIGTVVLILVALSFVLFARQMSAAGSAYAYVSSTFGPRVGFLTGWLLLLAYTAAASGCAALVGDFVSAAAGDFGPVPRWLPKIASLTAMLLVCFFVYHDMKLSTRLMLVLEGCSILAILGLCAVVVARTPLTPLPFIPAAPSGWSGIGYALVFAVLSFAGFEAAATLGEEATNPRRVIPMALLGSVVLAGVFFVIASYAQVVGFGLDRVAELASAAAPLNVLAVTYISRDYASLIDLAAAVSAFSAALGSAAAAARILFALGRSGLSPALGQTDARRGTPAAAGFVVGVVSITGLVLWAPRVGGTTYYGYVGTIGVLAFILVYLGVTAAAATVALRQRRLGWGAAGVAGTVLLIWPLVNNLYPLPAFPANLWPYVVVAWIALGLALLALRPELSQVELEPAI